MNLESVGRLDQGRAALITQATLAASLLLAFYEAVVVVSRDCNLAARSEIFLPSSAIRLTITWCQVYIALAQPEARGLGSSSRGARRKCTETRKAPLAPRSFAPYPQRLRLPQARTLQHRTHRSPALSRKSITMASGPVSDAVLLDHSQCTSVHYARLWEHVCSPT